MSTYDLKYKELLKYILTEGVEKKDRTGIGTRSITGYLFQQDLSEGFPALTIKRLPFKTMAVELEGFLKGVTDKHWYQQRSCSIWDSWSRPDVQEKEGIEKQTQRWYESQKNNRDLGPIYGWQLRHFGAEYKDCFSDYHHQGFDQLDFVLNTLKSDPTSRRMIVSYYNPLDLPKQALPPCHYSWQLFTRGKKLDIVFTQRSSDVFLGLPFNIAHYALLCFLIAKEFQYEPGTVTAFLGDAHLYNNQLEGAKILLDRDPLGELPELVIQDHFTSVTTFESSMVSLKNYQSHPLVQVPVAV